MQLELGVTKSAHNMVYKQVNYVFSYDVVFKGDLNVTRPVIKLTLDVGVDLGNVNYARVQELNRVYFIDGVRRLNNRVVEVSLKCDVLSTYRDDLLQCRAKYMRSIKAGDYVNVDLPRSNISHSTNYIGDISLALTPMMILTTIGG